MFFRRFAQAVRGLLAAPGLTLAATLTLGLGIGISTIVFSLANAVLLHPLPYGGEERLTLLWAHYAPDYERRGLSLPELADFRTRNRSFTELGAFDYQPLTISGG